MAPERKNGQKQFPNALQKKGVIANVQSQQPVFTAFVSKLSGALDEEGAGSYLRKEFEEFGIIVDLRVTRPTSSKKNTELIVANNNMWHAYIDFASESALEACCNKSYNESQYPFKVRRNLSTSERKEQSRKMIEEKRKVFLNNLNSECVIADLEREMKNYGTVQDVEIIAKPEQGKKIAFGLS